MLNLFIVTNLLFFVLVRSRSVEVSNGLQRNLFPRRRPSVTVNMRQNELKDCLQRAAGLRLPVAHRGTVRRLSKKSFSEIEAAMVNKATKYWSMAVRMYENSSSTEVAGMRFEMDGRTILAAPFLEMDDFGGLIPWDLGRVSGRHIN